MPDIAPPLRDAVTRRAESRFFSGMAAALAITVLFGFARTYYLRPIVGEPNSPGEHSLTPLIHVHGVLFTGWLALLLVQARLVAHGRISWHRRLGWIGALLASSMIVVGILTALHGVLRGVSPGGMDPRRFLVVPLFAILLFAGFVTGAVVARREPAAHKRLMLLATIALLPPALARWIVVYLGLGPPVVLAVSTLFVVPLVLWDLSTRGRLHAATLWGGLVVVASGPLRLAIANTDVWVKFAEDLVRLIR